jgi:riboflavin synthase
MFTGIIRAVGHIAQIDDLGGDVRMHVATGDLDIRNLPTGASIAVNGACLTAVELNAASFVADVSAETLQVTTLGRLAAGAPVNLEPALQMGESFDGHMVSGHVDGVGQVTALESDGRGQRLEVAVPAPLGRYVARKGSIAVDGVSLTVNEVAASSFGAMIIPHTRTATIIQHYEVGTAVNIEVDIVARYLERLTAHSLDDAATEEVQ